MGRFTTGAKAVFKVDYKDVGFKKNEPDLRKLVLRNLETFEEVTNLVTCRYKDNPFFN